MENNIKITQDENKINVVETKKYTMSINEIKNELNNISWRKDDLINQSKRLKNDFKNLENRETELKKALGKLENKEEVEILGGAE